MVEAFLLSKSFKDNSIAGNPNKPRAFGIYLPGVLRVALLSLSLAGCGGPVGVYHDIEGGAIARPRVAPPGLDAPYPNLASVPAAPAPFSAADQAAVNQRLAINSPMIPATEANQQALADLALPGTPPPPPDIPGLAIPAAPTPHVMPAPPKPPAPPVVKPVESAPVSIAFAPGSAILSPAMGRALAAIAPGRGAAQVLAAGFGEQASGPDAAALNLALARARAIADALTAAGVPAADIILDAVAAGSGGFVQLVY